MRVRFALLATFAAAALWGQDNPFNRPPKDVDEALRARIQQFFQYHVTGEYRKAETLVAADTQDYFYDHNKPRYISIEVGQIEYSDNFTKAKAVVLCEQRINNPAFGNRTFKIPTPSTWKLENGKWYWYVPEESRNLTPFGKMTAGPETGSKPASGGVLPSIPDNADFLFKQVQLEKSEVIVPPGEHGAVTVVNHAPGAMTLSVVQVPVGMEAKLDKATLQSGEKATLTVTNAHEGQAGEVRLSVDPIGQILTVKVGNK